RAGREAGATWPASVPPQTPGAELAVTVPRARVGPARSTITESSPGGVMRLQMRKQSLPNTGTMWAFALFATALAFVSVGARAGGALAIRRRAVRSFEMGEGSRERLSIGELDVGRFRIRETVEETGGVAARRF